MHTLRTSLAALLLVTAAVPAQAALLGPSSYWECIVDEMQDVQNDQAARAVMKNCKRAFPNISYVVKRSPLFGVNSVSECIAEYGASVRGAKAVKLMRTACNRVYLRR